MSALFTEHIWRIKRSIYVIHLQKMGDQDALVILSQRLASNASFWVPYPIVFANRLFSACTINVTEFTMVTATIIS